MDRTLVELIARRTSQTQAEARISAADTKRTWIAPLKRSTAGTAESGDDLVVEGYAAVFESDSELLYGFMRERIQRGAFKTVLKANPDVRLLVNHEGLALARTTNGSLALQQRPEGLFMSAKLNPDAQASRDLYALVDRGDVDQMSFAFTVDKCSYSCECGDPLSWECDCEVVDRSITEIGELFEVSVVTFPAYSDTSVVARDSEPGSQVATQAIDEELCETGLSADASTQRTTSDMAEAIRSWVIANGGNPYESGIEGSA